MMKEEKIYQTFADIPASLGIPKPILEQVETRISRDPCKKIHFTSLQAAVLSDPDFFWADGKDPEKRTGKKPKNLIVQGATSAGKTLPAELLAWQCYARLSKNVVYLVPLKALVMDKLNDFDSVSRSLPKQERLRIFASSADHQDHDTEISRGDYDITVMVYEKFFALLGQSSRFLKDCGLVIADELQMLENPDRGPKLEYALTKAKHDYKDIRLLGLLTADYKADRLKTWLDAKVIGNKDRPVGVRERIIATNGKYWERFVPGENDAQELEAPSGEPTERSIPLRPVKGNPGKKDLLLYNIVREHHDGKIIVFCNSKRGCRDNARALCRSGVLQQGAPVSGALAEVLDRMDEEEDRDILRQELLPYGVAYHNAGLPSVLREQLENEFRADGGAVRILFATETITIGMNLPADVMILYDSKVFRSKGDKDHLLSVQEYKNYIGRAGRLGLANGGSGTSYLFLDGDTSKEFSRKWKDYVLLEKESEFVDSALAPDRLMVEKIAGETEEAAYARACAPYYLNLLYSGEKSKAYQIPDIEKLHKETLSGGRKENDLFDAQEIVDQLSGDRQQLMRKKEEYDEIYNRKYAVYRLTPLGEKLAPYALSLKSATSIRNSFFEDGTVRDGENIVAVVGGLPLDYTAADLDNGRYLLDILYRICEMDEASKFRVIENENAKDQARNRHEKLMGLQRVIRQKLETYQKKHRETAFWEGSKLQAFLESPDEDSPDEAKLESLLKPLLLFDWIDEKSFKEIRHSFGEAEDMVTRYSADLERLGETASYLLEAVQNCILVSTQRSDAFAMRAEGPKKDANLPKNPLLALSLAFYRLAKKVKYGIADKYLLYIAGRHIYGVDRNALLALGKNAKNEFYENARLYVLSNPPSLGECLTDNQIHTLQERLRYERRHKTLEDMLDDPEIKLFDNSNKEVIESLKKCLQSRKKGQHEFFDAMRDYLDRKVRCSRVPDGPSPDSLSNDGLPLLKCRVPVDAAEEITVYVCPVYIDNDTIQDIPHRVKMTVETLEKRGEKAPCHIVLITNNTPDSPELADASSGFLSVHLLTFEMLVRIEITCLQLTDKPEICLRYIIGSDLEQLRSFKGVGFLENEISKLLRLPPLTRYLKEHRLDDYKDIPPAGSRKNVYKVHNEDGHWALKEIKTPAEPKEQDVLCALADTCARISGGKEADCCESLPEEVRKKLADNFPLVGTNDEVLREAFVRAKKVRLMPGSDSERLFFHTLVFTLKGLERREQGYRAQDWGRDPDRHIVPICDVDICCNDPDLSNSVFLQMADLKPLDLKDTDLLPWSTVFFTIGEQIAQALETIHKAGYVHCDVKPGNILYKDSDHFYLTDFDSLAKEGSPKVAFTQEYQPPEYKNDPGKLVTVQYDIYSLGKCLQDLRKETRILNENQALQEVLEKAAHEDPEQRYRTMFEFREAFLAAKGE